MNSMAANLHLAMMSFYQPNEVRHKILIDGLSFPVDAVRAR